MKRSTIRLLVLMFVFLLVNAILTHADVTSSTTIFSESFENGLSDWGIAPSRAQFIPDYEVISSQVHDGNKALRINGNTVGEIVIDYTKDIVLSPGKLYEISAWIKTEGINTEIAYHKVSKSFDFYWGVSRKTVMPTKGWTEIKIAVMADKNTYSVRPMLILSEEGTILVDDIKVTEIGSFDAEKAIPGQISISNETLKVDFNTASQLFAVTDLRNQKKWIQSKYSEDLTLIDAKEVNGTMILDFFNGANNLYFSSKVYFVDKSAEFKVDLFGEGTLGDSSLIFPQPFTTEKGSSVVFPMNGGLSFPVDDTSVNEIWVNNLYGQFSMAFAGATDGQAGYMFIVDTPFDAGMRITRVNNLLCAVPIWSGEKQLFAYKRSLTYAFFDQGGIVSIAKRYREKASQEGFLKTLAQKKATNPNIDKLVGAPAVFTGFHLNWPTTDLVSKMKSAGFSRLLWTNGENFEIMKLLDPKTHLISYDEVLVEAVNPKYGDQSSNSLPEAAWPNQLIIDKSGSYVPAWASTVAGLGEDYDRQVCDLFFQSYGQSNTTKSLATFPYNTRFSDALGCIEFRECYDPVHPMTRTESKDARVNYLKYLSQIKKLVTGTENGSDVFVPYVDFFDGMMTVGPGFDLRLDNNPGHNDPSAALLKYQVGQQYRVPLWQLVYHDCVVSYWHRSDNSNSFPSVWDKRDLFNVLYGTPPTYFFDMNFWNNNVAQFKKSYAMTVPVARATGYAEMTNFEYLTSDKSVQRSTFSNGIKVTVNFDSKPHTLSDGSSIAALGYKVTGMDIVNHWAKSYINTLVDLKSISGYPDGSFKPDKTIAIGEFVKILVSALGEANISNVAGAHWAEGYMLKAVELELVKPQELESDLSNYNANITRGQMARMVARALQEKYTDLESYASMIKDINNITSDQRNEVVLMYRAGIISGYPDGTFKSKNTATRAEASTMLVRFLNPSQRKIPALK